MDGRTVTRRRRSAPPSSTSGWARRPHRRGRAWIAEHANGVGPRRAPRAGRPRRARRAVRRFRRPRSRPRRDALRSCCRRAARRRSTSTRPSSRLGSRTSQCWSSRPTVRRSCATSAPRRRSTSRTCSGGPCGGSSTRAWPMRSLAHTWRSLARRARSTSRPLARSTSIVPFRDPLVGRPGPLPPGRPPQSAIALAANGSAAVPLDAGRGVILAGGRSAVGAAEAIGKLAERTRWPVLADPTSPARQLDDAITAFDALLRHQPFVDATILS